MIWFPWSDTASDYGTSARGHGATWTLARSGHERNHLEMLAAAITVWMLFSLWLIAPLVQLPPTLTRVAAALLWAELVALLVWSYGAENCIERTCAPVAQAAGIAARTDVPLLAGAFFVLTVVTLARRARYAR